MAHRCKQACNFGAISYINGRAYINQELCKECGMCKKACQYDAISDVTRSCKESCLTGALDINPEDKVVFRGPWTAKKSEAVRDSIKDAVDYVLTFEELQELFSAFEIEVSECEDKIVDEASVFGRGSGVYGGLTAAIENYIKDKKIEINFKPIRVSGGTEIKKAMTMGKIGKVQGNFIEGMMCVGGCINGAGKLAKVMKAKTPFTKINEETTIKSVLGNKKLEEYKNLKLER